MQSPRSTYLLVAASALSILLPLRSNAAGTPKAPHAVSTFTAVAGAHYPFRENMLEPLLLPDGRIEALSIARRNGQQTMQARYSNDEGRTWSEPENLFDWPRSAGGFALFERLLDQNGEIHIFILCDANTGVLYPKSEESTPDPRGYALDVWHVRTDNHRTRWDTPQRIWAGRGGDLLSVMQMRNGRIVLPIGFDRHISRREPRYGFEGYTYFGPDSVTSIYSDDEGRTWQMSPDVLSVQTPNLETYGACEPVVIQLNDGRVWMLMRTQRGRFYESFSPDGAHWSQPTPSKLSSSDSPAGLLRLKDGSLLLFSNASQRYPYAYGARYVLHGAISRDEGRTWRGFRELLRDPHRDQPIDFDKAGDYGWSYTFPTLTAQGDVLFTNWVEEGNVRTFTLFNPSWLYETHQETDFSNGIDDWTTFGSRGVEVENVGSSAALAIRKADKDWPAAAVWNFPIGARGTLKLNILLKPGFHGANLGLADHYSVPWDDEDIFYNVFNVPIDEEGRIAGTKLASGVWHEIKLDWKTDARRCLITVDGKSAGSIEDNRRGSGVNYLRLRSTSDIPDTGLLLRHVDADVSASWPQGKQ